MSIKKILAVCAALTCTLPATITSAATVSEGTVSGVFTPNPLVPGVLTARSEILLKAGDTSTFTTIALPVFAEFIFDVGTVGHLMPSTAEQFSLNPGETAAFTRTNTNGFDLVYALRLSILATDAPTLFAATGSTPTDPVSGFWFDYTSPTDNVPIGATVVNGVPVNPDNPSPVPLPAAGWLLLLGLSGFGAIHRTRAV